MTTWDRLGDDFLRTFLADMGAEPKIGKSLAWRIAADVGKEYDKLESAPRVCASTLCVRAANVRDRETFAVEFDPEPDEVKESAPLLRNARKAARQAEEERTHKDYLRQKKPKKSKAPSKTTSRTCCKYCKSGKPCGDSCISVSKTCRKGPGCAC